MKIDYSQRIFGLDLMRATAILFVVCSHALWVFPEEEMPLSSLIRFSGFMGVEIFFVLSGFLIGRIMLRIVMAKDYHPQDLSYFIVRRWFRTFPNYYLILLVNLLIALHLGRELAETLPSYFFFFQNFNSGMDLFFTESWSLPIEEFAYILGPFLLFVLLLPKTKMVTEAKFFWMTMGILLFFLFSKWGYHSKHGSTTMEFWNIELKAVVLYRIDAIYYGVLAAYISNKIPRLWVRYRKELFYSGFMLLVMMHVAMFRFGFSMETSPFFYNVLYLPACSIFIAMTLPLFSEWHKAPIVLLRPITFISLISYSMYLLHYSVILQLMRYELELDPNSEIYKWMFSLGYLFLTIVFSYLLYRYYERPMMDIRDSGLVHKWLKRR